MAGPYPSEPYSAEELARIQSYWGANDANSSSESVPPPPAAPAGVDPTSMWGPGAVPPPETPSPAGQAPLPPENPGAIASAPPQTPIPPPGPAAAPSMSRQAISFEREPRPEDVAGPPTPERAADLKRWSDAEARLHPKAHGGAGNPDPFGEKAAQKALLGTYDTEANAVRAGSQAERAKILARGEQLETLSRQQEEDAAIQRAEADDASRRFDEHMAETQRQLDEIREKKIDPSQIMHKPGMVPLAIVGGVMGGLFQGITGSKTNPFIDELDKQIDRNIAAQEKDIDTGLKAGQQRMTLLGEMRASFKDHAMAKMQARNLYYESFKQGIEAEAAKFDDPIAKARAEQAVAAIQRPQAQLQLQIAQAARAQAAAGAAHMAAEMKEQRARHDKIVMDTFEKVLASGATPEQAEYEAHRMSEALTTKSGPGAREPSRGPADPIAAVPKHQQEAAIKELEARALGDRGKKQIEDSFKKVAALPATAGPWDRDRAALVASIEGQYKGALGPGMSSDKDAETFLAPLMPATWDSDKTRANKLAQIQAQIDGKIATPILDRYASPEKPKAPGVQRFDADGKPLK